MTVNESLNKKNVVIGTLDSLERSVCKADRLTENLGIKLPMISLYSRNTDRNQDLSRAITYDQLTLSLSLFPLLVYSLFLDLLDLNYRDVHRPATLTKILQTDAAINSASAKI